MYAALKVKNVKGPGAIPEGVSRSRKAARTTPEGIAPGPTRQMRTCAYASFSTARMMAL